MLLYLAGLIRSRIKLGSKGMDHFSHDFIVGKDFINKTQKSLTISEKMINIIILKLNILFIKRQCRKQQMQIIIWEKIFTARIINESLILRIMLLQINKKNEKQPNRKMGKRHEFAFHRKENLNG